MPVFGVFFTFLQLPSKCDIQEIEDCSVPFCNNDALVFQFFFVPLPTETREDPFEGNVVDKAPTLSMSFPFLARQLVDLPDGRDAVPGLFELPC